MNDQNPKSKSGSRNRVSRYQRAQERRFAQKKADQNFYNAIFGVIGACILVVLGLAMISISGNAPQVGGGEILSREVFLGLSVLEIGGLGVVAVIAIFMWRRITKR